MSKAPIYVATRSGGRPDKEAVRVALERFISTGEFIGEADIAVEIMNHCIDKRWDFKIGFNRCSGFGQRDNTVLMGVRRG